MRLGELKPGDRFRVIRSNGTAGASGKYLGRSKGRVRVVLNKARRRGFIIPTATVLLRADVHVEKREGSQS